MFSLNVYTVFLDHRDDQNFDLCWANYNGLQYVDPHFDPVNFYTTARESSHFSGYLPSFSILFAPYEICHLLLSLLIEIFNFNSFIELGPFMWSTCLPS